MPPGTLGSRTSFIEKAKRHLNDGKWLEVMLAMDAVIGSSKGDDPTTRAILMEAHCMRANALTHMSKFDQAVEEYQTSLSISKELGDHTWEARSLAGLGDVSIGMGDSSLAVDFYKDALQTAQNLGDRPTEAQATIGLANSNLMMGKIDDAMKGFDKAIEVLSGSEPCEQLARAHNNVGETFCRYGRPDDAFPHLQKAVEIADRLGNLMARGYARANLAICQAKRGHVDAAMDLVDKAITDLGKAHDQAGLVHATNAKGVILGMERKYDLAILEIRKAETMAMRDGLDSEKAEVLVQKGKLLSIMDSAFSAKTAYDEAKQIFERMGNKARAKDIELELSQLGLARK